MYNHSIFLKGTIMSRSDQDMADFAARVSQYAGYHHNGYQILIAKQLNQEGCETVISEEFDESLCLFVLL